MNVYDFKVEDQLGKEVSLDSYKGNVILVINSATKCGFTPQYNELQNLYEKYKERGLVILDFPCNQFGNQAPGSVEEIVNFCNVNFGITFPIFSKIEVNGEHAHPFFNYLVNEKGFAGFNAEHELTPILEKMLSDGDPDFAKKPTIKWNFTKFVIDRNGKVVERYEPTESLDVVAKKVMELL